MMQNKRCTRYAPKKAITVCTIKHFIVNPNPASLHEAEKAETHAGHRRMNVQMPSAEARLSPAPKGISIATVAATFSFAINPQSAA